MQKWSKIIFPAHRFTPGGRDFPYVVWNISVPIAPVLWYNYYIAAEIMYNKLRKLKTA